MWGWGQVSAKAMGTSLAMSWGMGDCISQRFLWSTATCSVKPPPIGVSDPFWIRVDAFKPRSDKTSRKLMTATTRIKAWPETFT